MTAHKIIFAVCAGSVLAAAGAAGAVLYRKRRAKLSPTQLTDNPYRRFYAYRNSGSRTVQNQTALRR